MIITKKAFIGPLPAVTLAGKQIKVVQHSKCLGVILDSNLSWDAHVKNASRTFSAKVNKLYNMRRMPKQTLSTIYFQGILPPNLYGITVWDNCSTTLFNSVKKTHIRPAWFINNISKKIPNERVLEKATWKPIIHYCKRNLACKTCKIYNDLTSPLMSDMIMKSACVRQKKK